MPRVVHFELPCDDPERAVGFYKKVFGWEIQKWEGPAEYWLASTGPDSERGINGGLLRRQGHTGTVNTIGVASVDEYAAKVQGAGGQVIQPKMAIPGVGYLAYCKDTEGNMFGIIQPDPAAK